MHMTRQEMSVDFEDVTKKAPFSAKSVSNWVHCTLDVIDFQQDYEIAIRIVCRDEACELNRIYRHKNSATNVLSFPADLELPESKKILGDIVLCWPIIEEETRIQNKTIMQHSAHLVVHGVLHLLGWDHIIDSDAKKMEEEEIGILQKLGYSNPYLSQDTQIP